MSKQDGGPAFPQIEGREDEWYNQDGLARGLVFDTAGGMSLRDYFAAKAMQAYATASEFNARKDKDLATMAYELADAMLAERNKQ